MEYLFLIMLPMILTVGAVTSYTDIKYGKIRNKWIILGLSYAAIILLTTFAFYYFNGLEYTLELNSGNTEFSFFKETLLNFIFASAIGILLWANGAWCAADAKLFMTLSLLTPVFVYKIGYVRFFPSAAILINTFAIIFLVSGVELIKNSRGGLSKAAKNFILNPQAIFLSTALIFILAWIIGIPFTMLGFDAGLLQLLLILLVVIKVFGLIIGKLNKKTMTLIIILVFMRLIFDPNVFTMAFVKNFSILVLFFVFVRLFLQELAEEAFSRRIPIRKLNEGMVMSDYLVKDKKNNTYTAKKTPGPDDEIQISAEAHGLRENEIKKIHELHRKKKLDIASLRITSHTCFGPYIFAGTILSILFRGNIIIILTNSIKLLLN